MLPESIANPHLHISDCFKTFNPSFTLKMRRIPLLPVSPFFKLCYNAFIRGALFL